MESFVLLWGGIESALSWSVLGATILGVLVGLLIGVLPGLGPTAGVAIMLPVAVGFGGVASIAALAGVYYGAMYGGAVTSILLGIPGDPPSIMTVIDGHAMAKKGEAGRALGVSVFASFTGGLIGLLLLTVSAVYVSNAALAFGTAEMAALMFLSLSFVSVLGGRNLLKGFVSLCIGLTVGMVGLDPIVGPSRINFGIHELIDGVDFAVVAIGLFGLSEIFNSMLDSDEGRDKTKRPSLLSLLPRLKDFVATRWELLWGSFIGFVVGILPGVGATTATIMAYATAKKYSKARNELGSGAVQGIAAPEAANNSASYSSMIPLFTLGIPGSATTAIMLAGLMMLGLQPGPLLFTNNSDFIWSVFGSFYIGNLMLIFITILAIPLLASVMLVQKHILYPAIFAIIIFGVYSINLSGFDIAVALVFGLLGYLFMKLEYPMVPLILGLVLGPMLERGIRRTLIASEGDLMAFVERPISTTLIAITFVLIVTQVLRMFVFKKRKKD
jgi:putative tricarboxylic transport membrane protein